MHTTLFSVYPLPTTVCIMSWNQWDTARREAFARKVFRKLAELQRKGYEARCERFARLNDPTDPGPRGMFDQQMFDDILAAREAGRFCYWARGGPGPFMLMPEMSRLRKQSIFSSIGKGQTRRLHQSRSSAKGAWLRLTLWCRRRTVS